MSHTSAKLSTSFDMEVAFFDVDSYRIVWHGNYPKYFEIARCALLEKIGYPYEKMEESGYFFPVIDLQSRYLKPLVFKQTVTVTATLKEWLNKLIIDYTIHDIKSGDLLTKGQTTQVAVLMPEKITQFQLPDLFIKNVGKLLANNDGNPSS